MDFKYPYTIIYPLLSRKFRKFVKSVVVFIKLINS